MKTEINQNQLVDELRGKIQAQQKTIEVLMDAVENHAAAGISSLALFSENVNLERIVQRKTERLQRQEQKLQQTLSELQDTQAQLLQANKLESVGRMAAGIAHEINTPTQFIGTNVDFLKDAFSDIREMVNAICTNLAEVDLTTEPEQIRMALKQALAESEWDYLQEEIPTAIDQCREGVYRITSIVQAMKEFSHPSNKEMALNNVNRIIRTTVTVASNEWKYCAEVRTDLDPDLPEVLCLPDELGQVFLNLLINAAHAVEEKMQAARTGDKGIITIRTSRDDQYLVVSIADTGCGIPSGIQEKIFEPFFTTKVVGRGTGQGLAIAHNVIVKKHGGTLTFHSVEGDGTEFVIHLPLQQPLPAA